MTLTKQFKSSYAGEAEYWVGGQLYAVRYFANTSPRMAYNAGVLEGEIVPAVGTVRYVGSDKYENFPPAEVLALFPGFVGARWNTSSWTLEYNGPAPRLIQDPQVSDYLTFEGRGD